MNSFTFGKRIALGFSATIAITLILGLIAFSQFSTISNESTSVAQDKQGALDSQNVQSHLAKVHDLAQTGKTTSLVGLLLGGLAAIGVALAIIRSSHLA